MKTIRIFSLLAIMMAISSLTFAQAKTESFKVSGNCGMCKTKIEKAAKEAGATAAVWNMQTKQLTVTYSSSTTNTAKIQQKIADVGYDNAGFTATNVSYKKLHACCQYDRSGTLSSSQTSEAKMDCSKKDGKMSCCKDDKCSKKDGKMDCCSKKTN